ncbi:MAG: hypothetical protein DMG70_23520 [Acidobacteria bacterium]|nr:MAG: hypothetical protein DMG70_23520 [Acidobacteriota bacterium]
MPVERNTPRSLFPALAEFLRRIAGEKRDPGDAFANRLAPLRRGPNNRSGAAAVAEPDEEEHGFFPPRSSRFFSR